MPVFSWRRKSSASRFSRPPWTLGSHSPGLPGVVEVEHGGHGVDPQPVDVVVRQPVLGRRGEKAAHLVAAVVEDQALPVGMEAEAGVGVLEQVRPVELRQGEGVFGKVRRHPVEDHPDPGLVQLVDQGHELLGRPVAARRREETGRLVAPRPVEGVLHQREELDVGEPGLLHVMRSTAPPPRRSRGSAAGRPGSRRQLPRCTS